MRNSMEEIESDEIKEVKKNISGRRSIRDNYMNYEEEISSRKKVNKDRSISEPPKSYSSLYMNNNNKRLKTIREKQVGNEVINNNNQQGSSDDEFCIDEDDNFSKSNSQLNESDLDLDIESASHTPTPTLLTAKSRRINSETNLNDSKRRLTGFMGNRSKRFCASTSELSFTSHTHKSLFSPKNNQNSRSGSLYGSNMSLNSTNSRLFMINSPFYNGKTTFGGAASYPKRDINQSKVLRTPIQMRPSSSLSNSSNTSTKSEGGNIAPESNAAKRILEIMTQFSGPLKETRSMGSNINSMIKIPGLIQSRKRFGDEDLQLDRSISLTRPTAPYTRPIAVTTTTKQPESPSILLNNSKNTPQIPTMSQLLKMKRLQNNTERAREIASRSENFLNQVHEYKLPSQNEETQSNSNNNVNSSSSAFKMKSNITKNLLRTVEKDDLPPTPVNLPNIQLPELKSIPKFDIKMPESSSKVNNISVFSSVGNTSPILTTKTPSAPSKSTVELVVSSSERIVSNLNKSDSSNFKFSKPIIINISDADTLNLKVSTDSFTFSKPILIQELDVKEPSSQTIVDVSTKPDDLFKNIVAKQKKAQWECEICMIRNDMDRTKCISCDTLKRDSGINSESILSKDNSATSAPPTDDLFKKLAAQQKKTQWECTECMTKNDLDKEKCLCCETPKTGAKKSTPAVALTNSQGFKFGMPNSNASDDLFKNLAAQQKKSQWECAECMTSNDVSKEKCVCCETAKPGSKSSNDKSTKISSSSFSFGVKPLTSNDATPKFSFGMPPAATLTKASPEKVDADFKKIIEKQSANWECSACMTRNDQARLKCICCEQAKPSSDVKSDFSFGNKISSAVSLPAISDVKFSFGVPSVQTSKSDSTVNNKVDDESSKKKIDEVDKPKTTFSFGVNNASSTTALSSFTFKTPSIIKSTVVEEKKGDEKENSHLTNIIESKVESDKKIPAFTFGSSKIESVPEKKVAFGIDCKEINEGKSTEDKKSSIGGFSFPIAEKTSIAESGNGSKTNGGFSFGSFAKSDTTKEENKSSGFQFSSGSNNPFSSLATTSASPATIKPAFSFGSQKLETTEPQKSAVFGTFGNASQTVNNLFDNKDQAPKKDEGAPVFAFGNAKSTSSNMIFGSNSSSLPSTSITPMFGGANPTNLSTPTFGSTNNNNESGFGTKMSDFGSIQSSTNQSQKRSFDFGSSDVPQKKFDTRSQQQSQQQSSTPFQFNAQQDGNKPAFSFSATSTPQAFNFTTSNSNSNNNTIAASNVQAQQQQQQQPIAAPVMQFGTAPTVAIQGINAFGAQPAATTPQRKILRAARRAVRR